MKKKKMPKLPFISLVVCTYRDTKNLDDCISSLFEQRFPSDHYEVIVVVDQDLNAFKRVSKYSVRALFREKREGLSSARNMGVKNARGEIIAFTDDDCVTESSWLRELASVFSDQSVAGAGGVVKAYYNDMVSNALTLLDVVAPAYSRPGEVTQLRTRIAGANSAYRKTAIEELGGWDERITYGGDDEDFNRRLIERGYRIFINPKAVVYHKHRQTPKEVLKWSYRLGLGLAYVVRKHKLYSRSLRIVFPFSLIAIVSIVSYVLVASASVPLISIFILASLFSYFGMIRGLAGKRDVKVNAALLFGLPLVTVVLGFGGILGRVKGLLGR